MLTFKIIKIEKSRRFSGINYGEVDLRGISCVLGGTKSDIAFKELMRNEEVHRHFISDVLGIPLAEIKSVRLENPFLSRRSKQEKQCILDVRMQLNDERRINVELQIRRMAYWDKRSLFYLAKMYTDGLDSGQRYDRLKKCIVIDILDLLEDWGEVPGDIRERIYAEEDAEVLRKWHKTAARAEGFDDFRAKM